MRKHFSSKEAVTSPDSTFSTRRGGQHVRGSHINNESPMLSSVMLREGIPVCQRTKDECNSVKSLNIHGFPNTGLLEAALHSR